MRPLLRYDGETIGFIEDIGQDGSQSYISGWCIADEVGVSYIGMTTISIPDIKRPDVDEYMKSRGKLEKTASGFKINFTPNGDTASFFIKSGDEIHYYMIEI